MNKKILTLMATLITATPLVANAHPGGWGGRPGWGGGYHHGGGFGRGFAGGLAGGIVGGMLGGAIMNNNWGWNGYGGYGYGYNYAPPPVIVSPPVIVPPNNYITTCGIDAYGNQICNRVPQVTYGYQAYPGVPY